MWRSPDGSEISGSTTADVYLVRGFTSLLLNRKSSAVGPTGVYTCEIPDAENNLYIGLYNNNADSEWNENAHLSFVTQYNFVGIEITGSEEAHQISSSVNINCSSNLAVQTIRWLNNSDNGIELFNNSRQQHLLLQISSVSSTLNNTEYICEVVLVETGVVKKTIKLLVNSNDPLYLND